MRGIEGHYGGAGGAMMDYAELQPIQPYQVNKTVYNALQGNNSLLPC